MSLTHSKLCNDKGGCSKSLIVQFTFCFAIAMNKNPTNSNNHHKKEENILIFPPLALQYQNRLLPFKSVFPFEIAFQKSV